MIKDYISFSTKHESELDVFQITIFVLDYSSKLQKILQLQAPNIYFCAKIEKNMNKASECFLLGKVDGAIFHWMEDIKREPERSTNSSVLIIASLLSCYRLRESLLYLNWTYLHNNTNLPAVSQVFANILYQYFTGTKQYLMFKNKKHLIVNSIQFDNFHSCTNSVII